ncbi:hypothetical protein [Parvibaculum sp.]|jgi:hypothetical protein|uniref:hypothetical protein n=1 Tax=Parvibaculum sp. TaxID=2024848 RepID=UPI002FD8D670
MMKRLTPLMVLAALAAAPLAASAEEELAGGDAPRIAEISETDCRHIAPYLPGGADYVPGVAADGSAVAPADVDGGYRYGQWPVYEFYVTVRPAGAANPAFAATEIPVALVRVDTKTGRTTIDGEDVSGVDHALAEACARLHQTPAK